SEISSFRLGITSEITEQRVCIGEARVPSAQSRRCRNSETVVDGGTAIAEIQSAGPFSTAGRFGILQPFKISAELKTVVTMSHRDIVGERGFDVVVAGFPPSIEPVNVCGVAGRAAPTSNGRNQIEFVVRGTEWGGREF